MYLDFDQKSTEVSNYMRSLDLNQAAVTVEYDCNGVHYNRESIASHPDQAIVSHLTASGKGNLNFTATLHTFHSADAKWMKISNNQITITSKPSGSDNLVKFEARLMIDAPDATIEIGEDNKTISINGASEATVYVVGATNYVDYLTLEDTKPTIECNKYITGLKGKKYAQIKADHIADYQKLYNRSSLTLDNTTNTTYDDVPTARRVRPEGFTIGSNETGGSTYSIEGDNELAVLEFNFGKYLMISGSRPGGQPLTLQGVWNATNKPMAWRINLRARIADANAANDTLKQLLTTRTSPNMFDQHPTFQIDGNFGTTSGIAEMLLQSHDGSITILPALPQQWSSGEYKGFKARGNFEVDAKWSNCIPIQVKIYSKGGGIVKVRNPYSKSAVIKDNAEQEIEVAKVENDTVLVFSTKVGESYTITGYQS